MTDLLSTVRDLRQQIGANPHDQLTEALYTEAAQIADRALRIPASARVFTSTAPLTAL